MGSGFQSYLRTRGDPFANWFNAVLSRVIVCITGATGGLIRGPRNGAKNSRPSEAQGKFMTRGELVLVLLASATGRAFSPAQLQKSAFLVTDNLTHIIDQGRGFHFAPYDYGPFDSAVYQEAEVLESLGYAKITPIPGARWVTYAATETGVTRGVELLGGLSEASRNYIRDVVNWALAQSFVSLVKAIYEKYPDMRKNSIFRD